MKNYSKTIQIRWADIDANNHLRHSSYYDFAVLVRMAFLNEYGVTTALLQELKMGPILFREEATFRREIRLEDEITVRVELLKATEDFSRWSLRHQFVKSDGTHCAYLIIDGAWMDLEKRKLCQPADIIKRAFEDFPRAESFHFYTPEKKTT
jgi:acyl-CoA thioester hydrolase